MKKLIIICLAAAFSACGPSSSQQTPAVTPASKSKTVYTCTMHPEVAANKPGVCPKCGMDLIEKDN